jgi:hypothetical protein
MDLMLKLPWVDEIPGLSLSCYKPCRGFVSTDSKTDIKLVYLREISRSFGVVRRWSIGVCDTGGAYTANFTEMNKAVAVYLQLLALSYITPHDCKNFGLGC